MILALTVQFDSVGKTLTFPSRGFIVGLVGYFTQTLPGIGAFTFSRDVNGSSVLMSGGCEEDTTGNSVAKYLKISPLRIPIEPNETIYYSQSGTLTKINMVVLYETRG